MARGRGRELPQESVIGELLERRQVAIAAADTPLSIMSAPLEPGTYRFLISRVSGDPATIRHIIQDRAGNEIWRHQTAYALPGSPLSAYAVPRDYRLGVEVAGLAAGQTVTIAFALARSMVEVSYAQDLERQEREA